METMPLEAEAPRGKVFGVIDHSSSVLNTRSLGSPSALGGFSRWDERSLRLLQDEY